MSKLLSSKLYCPVPWKNTSVKSGRPNSLTKWAGAIYNFATAKCLPSPFNTDRSLHLHTSYLSRFLLDLFGIKLRATLRPDRVAISSSLNLRSANSEGTAIISGTKPSTSTNYLTNSSFPFDRLSFTYCKTLKKRSDLESSFSFASLKIFV
jgi:hypothetical protein